MLNRGASTFDYVNEGGGDRGCLICPNRRRRWRLPSPSTSTEEEVVSSSINYVWPNVFASEVSNP
nr:hypothetical protein Iba_chr14bCG8430 [Ipomoea batatas]